MSSTEEIMTHKLILILIFGFLFLIADPISTWFFLSKGGAVEGNPIIKALLPYGWGAVILFKAAWFTILLAVIKKMQPDVAIGFLYLISISVLIVVIWNFYVGAR
jgi:hypothetical protein